MVAQETDITPDMIEAGIDEMWGYPVDHMMLDVWEEAIRAGFLAMLRTAQKPLR